MPLLLKLYLKNHYALRDSQGTRSKRIRLLGIAFLFSLLFASTVALAQVEKYAFIVKWGSSGSGNGQFSYPYDVAVDGAGNVYIADTCNHRVQKFTAAGAFLESWGSYGTGVGQFNYSMGVGIGRAGNVYVTDACNNRIQQFTSEGVFVGTWGGSGTGNG